MAKSRAIWIQDKIGVIFVPSISSHFIAVSLIFILKAKNRLRLRDTATSYLLQYITTQHRTPSVECADLEEFF